MVGGLDCNPARAPTRERADLDRRFGIPGDAQDSGSVVSGLIDRGQLREDGIGFWDFFWGRVLATFLGK